MNQEKIREVALRVAADMGRKYVAWWIPPSDLDEYLTRCLQELSKDVEPVHWRAVLSDTQQQYRLTSNIAGFHSLKSAEQFVYEKKDFGNWDYTIEPLYLHPPLTEQDKRDAEQWRAYQKRKQDLLDRGFLKNPLRDEAMENGNEHPH